MSRIAYTVLATVPDDAQTRAMVQWLSDGHVQAVMSRGASGMSIVVRDLAAAGGTRRVVEVRYLFPDRQALDRYVQEHAPALRAEGAARWGSVPGVSFERTIGDVVFSA